MNPLKLLKIAQFICKKPIPKGDCSEYLSRWMKRYAVDVKVSLYFSFSYILLSAISFIFLGFGPPKCWQTASRFTDYPSYVESMYAGIVLFELIVFNFLAVWSFFSQHKTFQGKNIIHQYEIDSRLDVLEVCEVCEKVG